MQAITQSDQGFMRAVVYGPLKLAFKLTKAHQGELGPWTGWIEGHVKQMDLMAKVGTSGPGFAKGLYEGSNKAIEHVREGDAGKAFWSGLQAVSMGSALGALGADVVVHLGKTKWFHLSKARETLLTRIQAVGSFFLAIKCGRDLKKLIGQWIDLEIGSNEFVLTFGRECEKSALLGLSVLTVASALGLSLGGGAMLFATTSYAVSKAFTALFAWKHEGLDDAIDWMAQDNYATYLQSLKEPQIIS